MSAATPKAVDEAREAVKAGDWQAHSFLVEADANNPLQWTGPDPSRRGPAYAAGHLDATDRRLGTGLRAEHARGE